MLWEETGGNDEMVNCLLAVEAKEILDDVIKLPYQCPASSSHARTDGNKSG